MISPLPSSSSLSSQRNLSVMAWIEDPYGKVLLVKQTAGKRFWAFPGGKVAAGETLVQALHREIKEELSALIDAASLIDYYDRPEKKNIAFLFRVILKPTRAVKLPQGEIESFAFRNSIPANCTPSLKYFWPRAQRSFEPLSML